MKVVYDNKAHGYIIRFELEDVNRPIFVHTHEIVEARGYFVDNMIFRFENALREQLAELAENDANERYKDWCFDCDYCKDGVCEHNINCENGEMWAPKDYEDDFIEEDSYEDGLVNVAKKHLRDYLNGTSTNDCDLGDIVILSSDESPCDTCSNNPKNGGSGICNCTLGSLQFTY
jgi:hypothetical protein